MRRGRRRVFLGLLTVAFLLLLRVALWRPLPLVGAAPADGFTRVAGIVHVHTTFSDGGGSAEEVVAAARAAGLRFVAITDHNNLDAKPFEGEHDGVLVLVGTEISNTAGHLLGLGVTDPVFRFSGDAQDALDDVRELGGFAFAAHPLSARPDFVWSGWDLPGPWGIELLNGDSQWRSAGSWSLLRTAGLYPLNSRYALLGSLNSPAAALARWDQLLARRDVAGILGADAHNRMALHKRFAPRFPSYASIFSLAQDHVVLDAPLRGEPAADTAAILAALARGRVYFGVDALAPANAFSFVAEAEGRRWTMGDTLPATPAPRLAVSGLMPAAADVRLLKNGAVMAHGVGPLSQLATGPGVYRAEVRVPGWEVPWIVSNPIYVFDAAQAAERAARAAWPEAVAAPEAVARLDSFSTGAHLAAEFDASSAMPGDVLARDGGPRGGPRAILDFRLGVPGPGRPHVWCALTDREDRDLSGRRGLVLSVRGDGVYRVWLQVRDANPASPDEGTEWWFASVKTSREWRRLAVPFARLRSLNARSDGRLDLDKVRSIVFVLDEAAVKPGTAGRIEIADVGVY